MTDTPLMSLPLLAPAQAHLGKFVEGGAPGAGRGLVRREDGGENGVARGARVGGGDGAFADVQVDGAVFGEGGVGGEAEIDHNQRVVRVPDQQVGGG